MKYLIGLVILLSVNTIFCQGLTEKFTSFDISIGKKALSTTEGNYSLQFTEESIREIEYDFKNEFGSKISYTDLKLGIKFGKYNGLSHELFFDVTIGENGGGQFGYAIGYNFALEPGNFDILLRPSLGISSGDVSLYFDKIKVDTTGIVLSDNDYIDTDIRINIEHNVVTLTPNFEISFLYAQRYALSLNIGYDYVIKNKAPKVVFHPADDDYEMVNANFDDDTYLFRRNNEIVKSNIFNSSTLKYSIGISYYWNRENSSWMPD